MNGCQATLVPSRDLNTDNNPYVRMLLEDYSHRAFDEVKVLDYKGKWTTAIPGKKFDKVDLEIGTGNGYHFAHRSSENQDRLLIGIEVRFKPLIQAIRRALKAGASDNAIMVRFNAYNLEDLFETGELNDVYIHHPDPWPKEKHWKHRLIQPEFMDKLFDMQKPGSILEFKTDSRDYFLWSVEIFKNSKYEMIAYSEDLHKSEYASTNFVTHFEKIFLKQGLPIHYCKLIKKQNP